MLVNASTNAQFLYWSRTLLIAETWLLPAKGRMMKEATREATKKPMMNFGKRVQISPAPTFLFGSLSTRVAKKIATKKAMKPIRMFWMLLTRTAACSASGPRALPASTTAPVESTVPPIRAPPISWDMPTARMIIGAKTIIRMVKIMEIEMAMERSSFLAPEAAPVAMAADVPQTEVAEAMVMTSGLLPIFSTLVPNHHMKRMTIGVTIQAMPRP